VVTTTEPVATARKKESRMLRMLLALDDLTVGDSFDSDPYEVTVEEIVEFAGRYDPQPFHLDPVAAERSFFRGLAASGWHVAAISMRLMVQSVPFADGLIGAGGELAWPTPTRPGDVLTVHVRVDSITASTSRPERGRVGLVSETRNQAGEVRQRFHVSVVAFRRNAAPDGPAEGP
jgi:acyl dehydratase